MAPCSFGFSADQKRLSRILDSMAGLIIGRRDALTRFTQPLTGSYYFVPYVESLLRLPLDDHARAKTLVSSAARHKKGKSQGEIKMRGN